MSTVTNEATNRAATSPAQRLRGAMAAVRVSIRWFGTRKSLTVEQRAEAAEPFGTDARFLSAGNVTTRTVNSERPRLVIRVLEAQGNITNLE